MLKKSEEEIIKITSDGWRAKLYDKKGFSIFKKRHPSTNLILTDKNLVLGESLNNFSLKIPLKDIKKIDAEFEFMMPPILKIIHKSNSTYFHIIKNDFGFAILSEQEQDLRMQSRIQSWLEAINRTREKKESIKVRCLHCKTLNPENAKFCNDCGNPLV